MSEIGYGYVDRDGVYDEEAHARDVRIIWECTECGALRKEEPGVNEGGSCSCSDEGRYVESGESYGERRW